MSIVRHHGVIHVRVIPERTRTFERPRTVVGPLVSSFSAPAPVAQGIEHRPPEAGAQVRILPGALTAGMRVVNRTDDVELTSQAHPWQVPAAGWC
jgi:hypothetical protein